MRVAPMTSRFLDACRRRPTDVRPVWFMRQAGRYLKQYREIRAKHGILEICKRPDLAATVTLQPVEMLDVDAAIIFADLLLPVEPMGLKLRFAAGEGPVIDNPVRTSDDVDSLSTSNTDDLGYVGEAIQTVVRALAGKVPVIGFVGAPFTMASYMIEGGASRNFIRTKQHDVQRRDAVAAADGQDRGRAGARSRSCRWPPARAPSRCSTAGWARSGSDDYVRFVAPYSRALIERIRSTGVPVIHFGTGASGFFRELHAAGGDVMGVDWRINIDQAWMDISYRSAIQGNLDPVALFAPLPELQIKVHELLKRTGTRPGHIFNLGHGILPETPVENVKAVVRDGAGIPPMKQAVLLLAHGAPERLEDVESTCSFVRGGRPAPPRVVEEVKQRYAAIGGSSPLLALDPRAGRGARERLLGHPGLSSACATGTRSSARPWTQMRGRRRGAHRRPSAWRRSIRS